MSLLVAENLTRRYRAGGAVVDALRGVSLTLQPGGFVAIVGPSGCGKSTLLHLCGAMDRPTSGSVSLEGRDLAAMGDDALTRVRRERVGFVFQFFNLLPTLTIAENIALPLLLAGVQAGEALAGASALAERVGVSHRLDHVPAQVSGGEAQRAAIARAIVHRPALVVADEPTGILDSETGARVLALLAEINARDGLALLLATHAPEVAAAARRVVHLRDGRVERVDGGDAPEGPGARL